MSVRILKGDMRERLKELADNSLDACVTDPPYHLTSIVKRFGAESAAPAKSNGATGVYARAAAGFMGQTWDGGDVAFRPETWAEVWRVLKPGAHLVAFGGTRTYHRMACAMEDAGFEVRDMLQWLYGSGFPKSHNLDGEWQGWGTALKPACEPVVLARKPLSETSIAANVLRWGTGALNIDGCRIGTDEERRRNAGGGDNGLCNSGTFKIRERRIEDQAETAGRWPANVLHDGSEEATAGFPDEAGAAAPVHRRGGDKFPNTYGAFAGDIDEQGSTFRGDSGSAARFFYCAKADGAERNRGVPKRADKKPGNNHPTVKPLALMQWLCRLVTPKGGTVLDPFGGSGSTAIAADREALDCILCELSADYIAIAEQRLRADCKLFADVEVA